MTSTWHFPAATSIWLAKFGKSGDWLTDDDTSLTKFISLKTDQSVSSSSEADGGGQHFILNRVKRSNGPRHITELKRVSSPDSRQVFFIYKITVFSTTQKQSDQFDKIFIFWTSKTWGGEGEERTGKPNSQNVTSLMSRSTNAGQMLNDPPGSSMSRILA